jgi:hypothetical protein
MALNIGLPYEIEMNIVKQMRISCRTNNNYNLVVEEFNSICERKDVLEREYLKTNDRTVLDVYSELPHKPKFYINNFFDDIKALVEQNIPIEELYDNCYELREYMSMYLDTIDTFIIPKIYSPYLIVPECDYLVCYGIKDSFRKCRICNKPFELKKENFSSKIFMDKHNGC